MKNWKVQDPNYQAESQKYPYPVPSRELILTVLKQKPLSLTALANAFGLNRGEKQTLKHRIKAMINEGQIDKRSNSKLAIAKQRPTLTGKVVAHADGFGFFIPDNKKATKGEDLYLHYSEMQSVMHGDIIEASIKSSKKNGKLEGRVNRIIEHANKTLIATVSSEIIDGKSTLVAKPQNKQIPHFIFLSNLNDSSIIEQSKENAIKAGDIVDIEIIQYPDKHNDLYGKIIRILGDEPSLDLEIEVATSNHNLPHLWPQEVLTQVEAIPDSLQPIDYQNRKDLRHLPLVTIDGITAKDFDDAVYAKKTPKGYLLYIAIADVAHYVQKNSPLDTEAVNRATSVYFPRRVIPMLPENLSNGLCSLNPKVDRLCMVCEILIDHQGLIKRSCFYDAVMHSHARLTYETIEELLFNNNNQLNDEQQFLVPHLNDLKSAYQLLRAQRNQRGAIDFSSIEAEFEFDDNNNIAHIKAKTPLKSNQLIEELMVSANVCAAKLIDKNKSKVSALFRNHLSPSEIKLKQLYTSLKKEGISLTQAQIIESNVFSKVIEQAKTRPNFEAIQLQVLRSMPSAIYQQDNLGHFGLALSHYAHFTSPIRRYPDLLVHRAIKHIVNKNESTYSYTKEQMETLGEHCSMAERRADDAAYDVIDYLKCQYVSDKIGQLFSATITGITNFGIFARLNDEFVDGLIHISNLPGDYFNYDQDSNTMIGKKTRKTYRIGQEIDVIIERVNIGDRQIDLSIIEENGRSTKKPSKKSKKRTKKG